MGGAVDTVGDIIGGAADAVGDVVSGVGDVVGDVVETVGDNLNPATIAAIVYFASTGDPSALIESEGSAALAEETISSLGQQGFEDLLSTYGSDAAASGEIMGGFEPVVDTGSLFSSDLGSGNVLSGDLSGVLNIPADANPSAYYDPTTYNPEIGTTFPETTPEVGTGTVTGYTFGPDGSLIDPSGNVVAEGVTTQPLLDSGMSFKDIVSAVKNGMNLANLGKVIAGGGSISGALMPSTEDMGKFFSNLGTAAPLVGSAGLGYLAYKNRSDINKAITDAYNNYLNKQSGIASAYGVGAGPQVLPYNVAGVPLAQAQPRTAAQTVVMPKAAKGGSINDLYNEYSQLNNRMRNYRRLAKGGLI